MFTQEDIQKIDQAMKLLRSVVREQINETEAERNIRDALIYLRVAKDNAENQLVGKKEYYRVVMVSGIAHID